MINIFQPSIGKEELDAIADVFTTNWIGKGKHVTNFERLFAESVGIEPSHITSTNSCTEAIFLAGELFNFSSEDEIIVPSISFVAVGNSIISRGAKLVFCDVDPRTLNTTAELIEQKITPKTKAVFLNHYGGVACDMDPILALCTSKNILLIEDAACGQGGSYHGKAVGTFGDMGMWSFQSTKILSTGDGGMIYLKDPDYMTIAKEQLYMGLPAKQTSGMDSSANGAKSWWEVEVNRPGRRGILNDIAGVIGVTQMAKLSQFLERRQQIHDFYMQELANLSWLTLPPAPLPNTISPNYFFWLQLDQRDELARFLLEKGIYTTFRYWPLHRVKYFAPWVSSDSAFPNANMASERTLNIPVHQSLTDDDIQKIVESIKAFGQSKGL